MRVQVKRTEVLRAACTADFGVRDFELHVSLLLGQQLRLNTVHKPKRP
jgi:hypothetical protein